MNKWWNNCYKTSSSGKHSGLLSNDAWVCEQNDCLFCVEDSVWSVTSLAWVFWRMFKCIMQETYQVRKPSRRSRSVEKPRVMTSTYCKGKLLQYRLVNVFLHVSLLEAVVIGTGGSSVLKLKHPASKQMTYTPHFQPCPRLICNYRIKWHFSDRSDHVCNSARHNCFCSNMCACVCVTVNPRILLNLGFTKRCW
jgi:hypothetical protein